MVLHHGFFCGPYRGVACAAQVTCLEADFGQVRSWLEEVVEDKIALEAYILELQVMACPSTLPSMPPCMGAAPWLSYIPLRHGSVLRAVTDTH